MDRHTWGDLHTWISYGFIVLILVHLILHWRWLWQFASKRRFFPIAAGLAAGIVLLVVIPLLPLDKREQPERAGGGKGRQQSAHTERN